jgi:putative heme-binding domain-containing protein
VQPAEIGLVSVAATPDSFLLITFSHLSFVMRTVLTILAAAFLLMPCGTSLFAQQINAAPGGDKKIVIIKRSTDEWSTFGIAEELKKEGIFDPENAKLAEIITPPAIPSTVKLDEVLKLQGNATNGAQLVTRCVMCHQINGQGVEFGPNLDGWGRSQPAEIITQAILEPSKDIAHGYDGQEIKTKGGATIHGMLLTEGDIMIVRSMGGVNQFVPKSRIQKRAKLDRSMMLSAFQLGLTAQDVADIVAYMRSGN